MSRWKRLSSERLIATTLVLFASSIGGLVGCELIAKPDRSQIGEGGGGAGGEGGASSSSSSGTVCMPVDDMKECTTDECVNDMPVNTPVTAGTSCTSDGGSMCDDTGACVECLVASDCGTDDACQTHTCNAGKCEVAFAPVDTQVPTQMAGDCKVSVCDGNGAIIDKNDDADIPDDSNACTDDVCTAGMPSNPALAQGTNCGMNGNGDPLVCNDMAQCVGCNVAADCPGTDDDCSQRTCGTDGVCGLNFTAKDTPVTAQTDNDCLLQVCDGNGKVVANNDDADLPLDDGNACTNEVCAAGIPGHPAVANGSMCSDGDACTPMDTCQMGTCMAGTPITCMAQDQCHIAGTCDPMTGMCSNPNAADGTVCNDGDLCTQSDACQTGTCTGTNPVTCMASDQCHIAGTCDPMTGMCSNPNAADGTICSDNDACTQTDTCVAGSCSGANPVMCMASSQCTIAGVCDPMTGACSNPNAMNGTMCTSNMVNGSCTAGTCIACGDGIVNGTEACDDGNTTANDGCNATCVIETGFACTGAPSACTPVCGDGLLRGLEQCDDSNTTSGDGCSSACQLDISCGGGEVAVIVANPTPVAIPDNYTGAISTINVTQTGVVRKVIPTIYVTHAAATHLDIFMASPFGPQRILVADGPTGANFLATSFSDAAATAIGSAVAPFLGTFRPTDPISTLAGFGNQSANGEWVLRLSDDTTATAGTLNGWALALCIDPAVTSVCGNGIVEANEQCDDGNATTGDGCASCNLEITCGSGQTLVVQRSANTPLLIPDNTPAGITRPINITNTGVVAKAVAVLNAVSHNFVGDLNVTLDTPTGTNLSLALRRGSSGRNFVSTIFDDAAASAITSIVAGGNPYRGRFRPETAFGTIVGQNANGNWNLKTIDAGNADAGTTVSWTLGLCVAPPPVCGNGTVEIGEVCDDMNTMAGDGCSATCTVEQGYGCTGTAPSVCTFTCGNGTVTGNEQCDDGNTNNGDLCSSVCLYELTPEVEPNNACGAGNGPFTVPFIYDGAITPVADVDIVSFVVPAFADVKLETFAPTMNTCPGADTFLELRAPDCTTIIISDDDDSVLGACSLINPSVAADSAARNLAPGTYFARVNEFGNDGTLAAYKLQVTFAALCGDGVTTGSETCDDGNTMAGDGCGANCRVEAGYTCTGAGAGSCTANCGDGTRVGMEACDDGNTANNDGCTSACTVETGFSCTGQGSGSCTAICGDGLIRGGEGCDDDNTDDMDGCSSICVVEMGYTCMGEPSVCMP